MIENQMEKNLAGVSNLFESLTHTLLGLTGDFYEVATILGVLQQRHAATIRLDNYCLKVLEDSSKENTPLPSLKFLKTSLATRQKFDQLLGNQLSKLYSKFNHDSLVPHKNRVITNKKPKTSRENATHTNSFLNHHQQSPHCTDSMKSLLLKNKELSRDNAKLQLEAQTNSEAAAKYKNLLTEFQAYRQKVLARNTLQQRVTSNKVKNLVLAAVRQTEFSFLGIQTKLDDLLARYTLIVPKVASILRSKVHSLPTLDSTNSPKPFKSVIQTLLSEQNALTQERNSLLSQLQTLSQTLSLVQKKQVFLEQNPHYSHRDPPISPPIKVVQHSAPTTNRHSFTSRSRISFQDNLSIIVSDSAFDCSADSLLPVFSKHSFWDTSPK